MPLPVPNLNIIALVLRNATAPFRDGPLCQMIERTQQSSCRVRLIFAHAHCRNAARPFLSYMDSHLVVPQFRTTIRQQIFLPLRGFLLRSLMNILQITKSLHLPHEQGSLHRCPLCAGKECLAEEEGHAVIHDGTKDGRVLAGTLICGLPTLQPSVSSRSRQWHIPVIFRTQDKHSKSNLSNLHESPLYGKGHAYSKKSELPFSGGFRTGCFRAKHGQPVA